MTQFYGIQGSTLISIKSWLTSRPQSVIIDGEGSEFLILRIIKREKKIPSFTNFP